MKDSASHAILGGGSFKPVMHVILDAVRESGLLKLEQVFDMVSMIGTHNALLHGKRNWRREREL